jgi:hypothetical protein
MVQAVETFDSIVDFVDETFTTESKGESPMKNGFYMVMYLLYIGIHIAIYVNQINELKREKDLIQKIIMLIVYVFLSVITLIVHYKYFKQAPWMTTLFIMLSILIWQIIYSVSI